MFTDGAYGTRPVGRDRRGFLKELGLGGIARERRLSCRRLGTATFLPPAGNGGFLAAGWERRLSCRRLGAATVRQANWHKIGGESPLKRKD